MPLRIEEIDPGHIYRIHHLDGEGYQDEVFVKRFDLEHPEKYPGNTSAHPGKTMQASFHTLYKRLEYVQNQIPCEENLAIMRRIKESLWLLEERAAYRHGYEFEYRPEDMIELPMCPHCGHVVCPELGNARRNGRPVRSTGH